MKKLLFTILSAFMVSTMANAQYLNVKLKDGTYSFKTSSDMEVSFGDKKGTEPTESTQTVTVGDYKVTVKLADDTPANEVVFSTNLEGDAVKIKAVSVGGYGLECVKDNEVLDPVVDNGFHTFTVSDISNDVVVTIRYITVSFDLNITDNFKAKPEDIRIGYNSTVPPTYASAEKHSFRGWYTDKACTEAWDDSTRVTRSLTLYAKWAEDPTENKINNHEYVKLGGYYWATENVGEVKDENNVSMSVGYVAPYGYYYNYANAIEVAKTWNSGSGGGRTWTLPSAVQWQALIDYCDWTWYTNYQGTGMNGYLVTGRDDTFESGNSIFLPAAGECFNGNAIGQGYGGSYWSSTADRSDGAYYLSFEWRYQKVGYYYNRDLGFSVRAVLNENE